MKYRFLGTAAAEGIPAVFCNCPVCAAARAGEKGYTEKDVRTLDNTKIYATHGYVEKVKFGLFDLEERAKNENCGLVLFGHTHQPTKQYKDGVYYFNPGSIKEGFYGVVDITEKGIMCINKNLITY